ncbi:MAG: hypothetical protein HKP44_13515 [Desulfofustis sp.]|nr:hypothetical protein [Desulfofustis sp.]
MSDKTGYANSTLAWVTAAVCLLGCFYYFFFFYNRALVEVEIEVEHKTRFKLYWAQNNESFSEDHASGVTVVPGRSSYTFFLTNLGGIDQLRIDPFQYQGSGTIKRLTLSQPGYEPVEIDLAELSPRHEIGDSRAGPDGLKIGSTGKDPYLMTEPTTVKKPFNPLLEGSRYAAICLIVLLVIAGCRNWSEEFAFVPVLLAVVLALIVVMASVSKRNAHPDEYVHLEATSYYQENWLPPVIDESAIERSYSAYGFSRLNNGEIYYLFAGKFTKLLEPLNVDRLFALRSFNILLFALIFLYAARSVEARLVALPLLISPQVWYIFSYCVSDAFGLFLCFLAGCELVRENSFFNRVSDVQRAFPWPAIILVSILLGLLFLLKATFYPFIILIYVAFLWSWLKNWGDRWIIFTRVLVCSVIALTIAGARIGADYYVNGLDRNEKLLMMQEKTAHYWYKPSTELNKKHASLYMKERGSSLKDVIVIHKWFAKTFVTGVGKYGYFTISGSDTYYRLMKWSMIIFLIFICGAVAVKGNSEGRMLLLLVVGLSLGLIGASLHQSWTISLQPQGRYLLTILPMIGVVLARNRQMIDNSIFILIVLHLFLLSFYSFVFVGIAAIPRA